MSRALSLLCPTHRCRYCCPDFLLMLMPLLGFAILDTDWSGDGIWWMTGSRRWEKMMKIGDELMMILMEVSTFIHGSRCFTGNINLYPPCVCVCVCFFYSFLFLFQNSLSSCYDCRCEELAFSPIGIYFKGVDDAIELTLQPERLTTCCYGFHLKSGGGRTTIGLQTTKFRVGRPHHVYVWNIKWETSHKGQSSAPEFKYL
ncbi:uncharacterized protein [Coffea arabica]|uniref:Uncharacterized protein isoform X3 n=1 Tax=Coffea arabica TaxID=13443 RepID=A0ABM4V912_COFAR